MVLNPISIRRVPVPRLARSSASVPPLAVIRCASPWCTRIRGTITNCAIGLPPAVEMPILTGHLGLGGGAELDIDDFFVPFDKAANFPWKSHALWFYTQMVRWGHVEHTPDNLAIARDCYRPDLYRSALKP